MQHQKRVTVQHEKRVTAQGRRRASTPGQSPCRHGGPHVRPRVDGARAAHAGVVAGVPTNRGLREVCSAKASWALAA